MDKKTQAPPPISPEERDMLLDRLEEQGLVYLDDKTAVFCLDGDDFRAYGDSLIPVSLPEDIDTEAMWKLGISHGDGYTKDDVEILVVKDNYGRYDLGRYECGRTFSLYDKAAELDERLNGRPMDEIRAALEKAIIQRAGGLTPELVGSLRAMGAGLNDFAKREREDMDISRDAADEEPEEKWSNTPFANFSLDTR